MEDKREGKQRDGRVGVEDICSPFLEAEIKQISGLQCIIVCWKGEKEMRMRRTDRDKSISIMLCSDEYWHEIIMSGKELQIPT